ncbi:importin-4-like [Crotalus adamanteus]|uniref:Importin-4-like n=1 Tax=Crotalus adamanteus TaxID=8729 RepID=A0AAW1B8F2_CROAD
MEGRKGRRDGRKEGKEKERKKTGRKEERMEGRKRKEERMEGRKRKEKERQEGRMEGRKRKEGKEGERKKERKKALSHGEDASEHVQRALSLTDLPSRGRGGGREKLGGCSKSSAPERRWSCALPVPLPAHPGSCALSAPHVLGVWRLGNRCWQRSAWAALRLPRPLRGDCGASSAPFPSPFHAPRPGLPSRPPPAASMAAQPELEQILALLLQPDNAVIQQATAQLKEVLKQPAALSHLCHVMTHSQDPQIQQFAAVLLRRRLSKHWKKIAAADQEMLKTLVLNSLQRQTDHKVSLGLAQLAAVILKNETLEKWPQMLQSIQHGARSRDPSRCQMALLLLQSALDLDPDQFSRYYKDLLRLFHQTLNHRSQPAVLYYSLRSLTAVVGGLSSDEVTLMSSMVPKVIAAIRELIHVNEVQASEAMEVFDELLETEVAIVVQHLSEVVNFCLEVASDRQLSDGLRVKALSCISYLVKLKSKAILKHKLLSPLLAALFPIMSAEPPPGQMDTEDELTEEEIEDQAEVQKPKHFAVQVVDMLALYLPPEKLFPQLTPLMEPALLSPNPYHRKAGLMCLAVLAEGCGDHIRNKHLQPMLQVVCRALADDSQVVRNAALFALGQFSENLQPDIARFSDDIMPLLLHYLEGVQLANTTHLAKAYYALENFVENLEDKIAPYLPALMERMLSTLTSPGTPRTKELAVSAIGAIAQAAKESLLPYFQAIMEHLTSYMLTTREDLRPVQIQSIETMAILANVLDKDIFQPLSEKCCQLGLDLCDRVDDPDLRRCTYSLFGSLANVMGDSISPYLPRITTLLIYSLKSTEGIKPPLDSGNSFLLFEDEEEEAEVEGEETLTDEEEEEDLDPLGMCVRSAFMDEKEDACIALGEIAASVSMPFLPYIETSFQEVSQLLPCPHIRVRKAAFEALGQFIVSLHRVCQQEPSETHAAGEGSEGGVPGNQGRKELYLPWLV